MQKMHNTPKWCIATGGESEREKPSRIKEKRRKKIAVAAHDINVCGPGCARV